MNLILKKILRAIILGKIVKIMNNVSDIDELLTEFFPDFAQNNDEIHHIVNVYANKVRTELSDLKTDDNPPPVGEKEVEFEFAGDIHPCWHCDELLTVPLPSKCPNCGTKQGPTGHGSKDNPPPVQGEKKK
jgi:hypothetical protein